MPRTLPWAAVALAVIVGVGGWLRFSHANWDDGQHLHPDERYLSFVANDISWPGSLGAYFDVERSTLSPFNTEVGRNYLYGTLPLFATKALAGAVGRDSYSDLNLVGRRLSALVDLLTIVLVFLFARLLFPGRSGVVAGLLAATCYALAVTAIQHAHFFVMESWLVFFSLLTLYLAALLIEVPAGARPRRFWILSAAVGASAGLALATKLSAAYLLVPIGFALLSRVALAGRAAIRPAIVSAGVAALGIGLSAYLTFRLAMPYAFADSSWLRLAPNENFRAALEEQRRAIDGEFLYPPAYQWLLSEPVFSPLENLLLWGLGPALAVAALAGLALLGWIVLSSVRGPERERDSDVPPAAWAMLLVYAVVLFAATATRFAHPVRYLLPLVPVLCLAAAYALTALGGRSRKAYAIAVAAVLGSTLLYAVSFQRTYTATNTRVAATDWISNEVPPDSSVAVEHWDDPLPLGAASQRYRLVTIPVFDPDDAAKLRKLYDGLRPTDYYVLSSPRAWRSIGRLPDRFPVMARFYRLLFEERLGFVEAARFTSYPRLLGIEVDDRHAEEQFWVYDHPPVVLFRKTRELSWPEFRRLLSQERT